MADDGRNRPLVIDGTSWKSALAIPRALWGLFVVICLVLGLFPFRFPPEGAGDGGWWVYPLVGAVAFAAAVLLPSVLLAAHVRRHRPKSAELDDGSVERVFLSAKAARQAFVRASLPSLIASLMLATLTVGSGVAVYLAARQVEVGLVLGLCGLVVVLARVPTPERWQRRAEEAFGARFPRD